MTVDQPTSNIMRARRRRRAVWMLAAFAAVLVIVWAVWDWNWFKAPIERRVEAATGREFAIDGDLDVDVFWPPTVVAEGLRLGNVEWSDEAQMLQLDRAVLSIALWPLLRGEIVLPSVSLTRPRLVLERNSQLEANWQFNGGTPEEERGGPSAFPTIRTLTVDNGELVLRESSLQTHLRVDLDSGKSDSESGPAPLLVSGEGTYRDFPFTLDGQVESPLQLRDQARPYRVSMKAEAGATTATATGALYTPLQFHDFDLDLQLRGDDLADLFPLLGVALPPSPPYTLEGRLQRDGMTWHYRDFSGRVGDSDLAGEVRVDTASARPRLIAQLTSEVLDFDDLGGFLGLPPSASEGETASTAQERDRAQRAMRDRVLPQAEYRLDKLRAMDADVTLVAAEVRAPSLPIESLDGHLTLDDGLLRLQPLNLRFAGGRVDTYVTLDGSVDPIISEALISLVGLELPKLFPDAELAERSRGHIGGRLVLNGRGNSIASMLGSANGEVGLVMGRGQVSNLLLELAGLDLQEALRFLLGEDRVIPVRCAFADFEVKDGVMETRAFAFDTSDTVVYADGQVDLAKESFELALRPEPKDRSLVSLRSPLRIGGTFKDPSVSPEPGPLLVRSAAAALLYSVAPPAALLALLETGPGEDADCQRPDSAGQRTGTQSADTRPSEPASAAEAEREGSSAR